MRPDPSLLWTWPRAIDRVPYLLTGALLFLVKFALDWAVASQIFGQTWSPLNYLIWPNDRTLRVFDLGAADRTFALTMLLLSVPFIGVGVMLTLHRLYAAGLPRGLVILFFVPLVNLLLFAALSVLPTRELLEVRHPSIDGLGRTALPSRPAPRTARESRPTCPSKSDGTLAALPASPGRARRGTERLRRAHSRFVCESYWLSGLVALLVTVPLTLAGVVYGANVLRSYGFSLFVGAPFAVGMISVLVFGFSRPQPFGACMAVAFATAGVAGLAALFFALEGIICLIMAAPIALFLVFVGAVVGYAIQARPWLTDATLAAALAVLLTLPALMAAEAAADPEPTLRAVRTEVVIAAPPEAVWRNVVAFPPLSEPDDWLFRAGVAYPTHAEIHGQGMGAVRHCVFSTGTFVEPIEVWDEPRLLRFRVDEQPEPMREWSPYHIHPPHLDRYLVSRRGQFLLESLPGGRTRLEGTTWYTNRMWPAPYWGLWSDAIIQRIHRRVLDHIRALAERDAG